MNDIKFNISEHWLPVNEKRGTIDKDTLRIKVSGINFHTQQEASSWGLFTGYIKPDTNNTYELHIHTNTHICESCPYIRHIWG